MFHFQIHYLVTLKKTLNQINKTLPPKKIWFEKTWVDSLHWKLISQGELFLWNLSSLQSGNRFSHPSPKVTNLFLSGNTWYKLSQRFTLSRFRALDSFKPVPFPNCSSIVFWKLQMKGEVLQMRSWIHAVWVPVFCWSVAMMFSGRVESLASFRILSTWQNH